MLTAQETQQVLIDLLNDAEPTITGEEADALRVKFQKEIDDAEANGTGLDLLFLDM